MIKFNALLTFFFIIFSFQSQTSARAEDAGDMADSEWRIIESGYFTIFCHPDVDIKKVNKRIKIRLYDVVLDRNRSSSRKKGIEENLAEKFDRIFQKVERILDMYPRKMRLKLKIYKSQSQLNEAFKETFGRGNTGKAISYYVHKYTTIYTTERAISQGVIAHEMGHAVVDHHFLIRPPEKIRELLAQYVEIHLED